MAGGQSESHVECGDVGTWVVLSIIGNLSGGGGRSDGEITLQHYISLSQEQQSSICLSPSILIIPLHWMV